MFSFPDWKRLSALNYSSPSCELIASQESLKHANLPLTTERKQICTIKYLIIQPQILYTHDLFDSHLPVPHHLTLIINTKHDFGQIHLPTLMLYFLLAFFLLFSPSLFFSSNIRFQNAGPASALSNSASVSSAKQNSGTGWSECTLVTLCNPTQMASRFYTALTRRHTDSYYY